MGSAQRLLGHSRPSMLIRFPVGPGLDDISARNTRPAGLCLCHTEGNGTHALLLHQLELHGRFTNSFRSNGFDRSQKLGFN